MRILDDPPASDIAIAHASSDESPVPARPSRCFLCGDAPSQVVLREGPWEGRQCSCGLVYTFPQPLEGMIDATEEVHPDDFYGFPAHFKAKWMSRRCPPGRLLEVGCGNGHFLFQARKLGYDVTGLEPSPFRAQQARTQYQLTVQEAFLANHGLPLAQFDVVYHCDMLAHFHDPLAALQSMVELLRPGGVLCFEVGIMGGMDPSWYHAVGRVGLERHLWLYSAPSLDRLFAEARLQVVARQRFGLAAQHFMSVCTRLSARSVRMAMRSQPSSIEARRAAAAASGSRLSARSLQQRLQSFLRYRIGPLMPAVGPQTLLYVMRPQ
jgi:SAM-dependent methyltransferase